MNPRRIVFLAVLLLGRLVYAAEPLHAPLPLRSPVQDKNFFLLSAIERKESVRGIIESDPELRKLREEKVKALTDAPASKLRFTDDEMSTAAAVLRRLYETNAAVRELTDGVVRPSGAYERYRTKSGGDLLAAAWLDAARGINNIIDVYGNGKAPRYPAIDAASFDVKSEAYGRLLNSVAASLAEERFRLFFQPTLRFALHLLEINDRDEAGRHEPTERGINAAAKRRLAHIAWSEFPYTAIIVPGYGPERAASRLAPEGRVRIEIAARRYRRRKAPVIIVSGGYVHPNQTPYSEAIEMKTALVRDFGVPADAIIVEPHARHTTTNVRNAARLLYRYGIPFERKALITTDSYQSAYIESAAFAARCEQDLGYRPAKMLKRVSDFDLELLPDAGSLQIDPMDPLDP